MAEKVGAARVVPFCLAIGVMVALYSGYATPSETAGLGGIRAGADRRGLGTPGNCSRFSAAPSRKVRC
jgi:hypothetical protein